MRRRGLGRAALIAGVCAVAGAGAGIAASAAAPGSSTRSTTPPPQRPPFGRHDMAGGPPVHVVAVVPNQAGTGFDTVTTDGGILESVSGSQLVIKEGTPKATYKVVTLTIPSGATVRRDDAKASLGDLKPGDRVRVTDSPRGTFVNADSPQHQASEQSRHGPRGPDGPGGPGGPGPWGGGPPPGQNG